MDDCPLILTLSNRLELLFDALSVPLFENRPGPFGKILIIVPSLAMKTWVMEQSALTQKIAYGFEVVLLNDAIRSLSNFQPLLNPTDLAIKIEAELKRMDDHPFKMTADAKQAEIALELADLFLKYGEYHEEDMEKWTEKPTLHWQSNLWNRIYTSSNKPLYAHLKSLKIKDSLPLQVHLFGFSYLSDVKQSFFENLNKQIPVQYWLLSPSRMLWSDHKSRKEQAYLSSCLEKRGVKFSQIQEMQGYLEESHPLIGNNGRLGRKWREKMEDSASFTAEIYGISEKIAALREYQDFMLDGVFCYPSCSISLLEAIQADLALLSQRDQPFKLDSHDRSLEFHKSTSRFREIEALYETLLRACSKEEIEPGNILVMAPNLEQYTPFIKTVFNRVESKLPFEIQELASSAASPYLRTFFSLMELSDSRWDIHNLFELLQSPHFTCKKKLKFDDLSLIKSLLIKQGVHWGIDRSHRETLCENPLIEPSNQGSFEGGVNDLLKSFVYQTTPETKKNLSNAQAETLSTFLDLFKALHTSLNFIRDDISRTTGEWEELFGIFIDEYLGSYHDEEERDELKRLLRRIQGKEKISFKSFLVYLKRLAEEPAMSHRSKNLNAVRFCPLLPMRAIPANVIVLLGMNSEIFPKIERKCPLRISEPTSYLPTRTDYDRYLFLESILSARKKWIVSYLNTETASPSCLVQEMLHYLDQSYRIGDELPSEALVHDHPDISFHPSYFNKDASHPSTSFLGYKSALACKKAEHVKMIEIQAPLKLEALDLELMPKYLTLDQLKKLLRNPIKHHLNQAHGIYLYKDDPAHPDMEEFTEEKLWESEWLKWALRYPVDKVIEIAEAQKKFPLEPFKTVAKERLRNNLEDWKTLLSDRGIFANDIFSIEFSHDCKKAEQVSPLLWKVPKVELFYKGKRITVTGLLPYVSTKGILSLQDPKAETLATMLPEILLLNELPIGITQPQIIFLKKNKTIALSKPNWNTLLDQYIRSLYQPLPHTPSWISALLDENPEGLHHSIKLSLTDHFGMKQDPYIKWAFPDIERIDCSKLILDWKDETKLLFGSVYESI